MKGSLPVLPARLTPGQQVGLSWQSVHDGKSFVHEPLRLNVFIEAPQEAIDRVVAKHKSVRQLVDNGWLHLFMIGDGGQGYYRYADQGHWQPMN